MNILVGMVINWVLLNVNVDFIFIVVEIVSYGVIDGFLFSIV